MSDHFPTPRGALSPEGVTAAADRLAEAFAEAERRTLGVPGYAGAKGAVPEPQRPTTEAGQRAIFDFQAYVRVVPTSIGDFAIDMMFDAIRRDRLDSLNHLRGAIPAIEAEARAAAPPDIDVERLRELLTQLARIYSIDTLGPAIHADNPEMNLWRELIALASPDATRREPSGE